MIISIYAYHVILFRIILFIVIIYYYCYDLLFDQSDDLGESAYGLLL